MTRAVPLAFKIRLAVLLILVAAGLASLVYWAWTGGLDPAPQAASAQHSPTSKSVASGQTPTAAAPQAGRSLETPAASGPWVTSTPSSNASSRGAEAQPTIVADRTDETMLAQPVTAAVVDVGGGRFELKAQSGGQFPRIYVEPQMTARVRLTVAGASSGQPIYLTEADGGQIQGPRTLRTDASGSATFGFQLAENTGLYRVVIESDSIGQRVLEFWAGPPLPMRTDSVLAP